MVGKSLDMCRTDLHCLKGGNGFPCPSGGHGTSWSSSPAMGTGMYLLFLPLPLQGSACSQQSHPVVLRLAAHYCVGCSSKGKMTGKIRTVPAL